MSEIIIIFKEELLTKTPNIKISEIFSYIYEQLSDEINPIINIITEKLQNF